MGKNSHVHWRSVEYTTALSNICKSCHNIFPEDHSFEVAQSFLALFKVLKVMLE